MSLVARLKVVLDDVEPKVVRRFEVPVTMRLSRLHTVLQIMMGWTDTHLYEFTFRGSGYGIPDPDWETDCADARSTSLSRAINENETLSFKYLYDFGDAWSHSVKVEKIEPAIPGLTYPFLLHASGRCPPEDVGGPDGYAEFLRIIADDSHEEFQETIVWAGGAFDPAFVDLDRIETRLAALAKRGTKSNRR